MTTVPADKRNWQGPVILSHGFRPLFLGAAIWATLGMAIWISWFVGGPVPPTAFAPVDWHVHTLLYGYVPAVMGGFLLTAVPNWTGRSPVVGWPLLALLGLWLLGRIVVMVSAGLTPMLVAMVDLAYPIALAAVVLRDIVAAKIWQNIPVVLLLALLAVGNALFHWEAARGVATDGLGMRLGLATIVMLILLIGGRVVPAFTRNWLNKRAGGKLPAMWNRFDASAMAFSGLTLVLWTATPAQPITGAACLLAGLVTSVRLARWAGWRTLAEPLVAILHIGYGFVPLGFLLMGASILAPDTVPRIAALHAWTVGAVGVMTLAVMSRATLGHTGHDLHATLSIVAIYTTALMAALARIVSAFFPGETWILHLSATAWILAYGGFVLVFWGALTQPKTTGQR